MYNSARYFMIGIFLLFVTHILTVLTAHAAEPVVVVIDPGHGGENLGAEYGQYTEKEINMVVARAMKAELEKYEGVTVYLTHESPETDMELIERAEFAKEKNADMLFCLHFNMSEDHNYFGSEVWISAFDHYYAKGYAFARIEMDMLTDLGLYSRGIKTRLNDEGEDYYGIIRESRELGLNAVLIEHCHLDQEKDQPFYTRDVGQLEEFGRLDATAAAKYFRLRSEELGADYSDYPVPEIAVPGFVVKPDLSPPDVCILEMDLLDATTGEAVFTLTAQDYDSRILYYAYSLDGGKSYVPLEPFPEAETTITFSVMLPFDQNLLVSAAAHNAYDQVTISEPIEIMAIPGIMEADEDTDMDEDDDADEDTEKGTDETEEDSLKVEANEKAGQDAQDVSTAVKTADTELEESALDELAAELKESQDEISKSIHLYHILIMVAVSLIILVILILISRIIMAKGVNKKRIRRKKDNDD